MIQRGRPKKLLPKIAIGVLGFPGSGIEQVASYLETRYMFTIIFMNKLIKKEIIDRNLKNIDLKETDFFHDEIINHFPESYFPEKTLQKIYRYGRPGNMIINLYNENEIKYFKKYDFFYTIGIHANQNKRWQRYQHTHKKDTKFEEFVSLDQKIADYKGKSKIKFDELLQKCDYKIYNNESLGELYTGVERVLKSIGKRDKEIAEILMSRRKVYTSQK